MTLHRDETLVRYLVGETTDEERDALENDYFANEALAGRLAEVETGLIDAYVRGELSELRRAAFERRYLGTEEGRARVDVARGLAGQRGAPVQSRRTQWIYPLAAVAASAVLVTTLFVVNRRSPPASETSTPAPVENVAPTLSTSAPPTIFKIPSGTTRSAGETSAFAIPPGTETVYLDVTLAVPSKGAPLSALITTPEGAVVHRGGDVTEVPDAGTSHRATAPARLLPPGDYILTIAPAGEPSRVIGEFAFRVVNR